MGMKEKYFLSEQENVELKQNRRRKGEIAVKNS